MKKTIFAVSDIHNNYEALVNSLADAGYDENNPNYLLISCGDAFDRMPGDSLRVYDFLKRLEDEKKAIILRGNHTGFLQNYLDGSCISPWNYYKNGTDETLADFLHQTSPFQSWCLFNNIEDPTYEHFATWLKIARKEINDEFPELLPWLENRPNYYETKNYIFTHGSIDTDVKDWKLPKKEIHNYSGWEACHFDNGSFFGKEIKNTDKTIVIGHFSTNHLRKKYNIDDGKNKDDILTRDDGRVIAIDTCTVYTNKVNVLVIEDEEISNE